MKLDDIEFHALAPFLAAKSLINLSHVNKQIRQRIIEVIPSMAEEKYGYYTNNEEFFERYKYCGTINLPNSLYGKSDSDIIKMNMIIEDYKKYSILCDRNDILSKSKSPLAKYIKMIDYNTLQLFDKTKISINVKENTEFSIEFDNKNMFEVYNDRADGVYVKICENIKKFYTQSSILIDFIKEIFCDEDDLYEECFNTWKDVCMY